VALIDATLRASIFRIRTRRKHLNVGLLDMQPEIVGVVGHVEHWG